MGIKEKSMLVSLTVGKPQLTKTDSKGTQAAEAANDARHAGQYRKDLYPKHLVQPLRNIESAARAYIERKAYQWERGRYLLPCSAFIEFGSQMEKFKLQFDQAVTAFLQNWVNVLDEAKQVQGKMFNEKDYPDLTDLRSRFYFQVNFAPVPDARDFRVDLHEEELASLREQVEEQITSQYKAMITEPMQRLYEALARLQETMGKPEREVTDPRTGKVSTKPPIFRDTVVDNIIEEVELIRSFTGVLPDDLTDLAGKVEESLPSAEELRQSPDLRNVTSEKAGELLDYIKQAIG